MIGSKCIWLVLGPLMPKNLQSLFKQQHYRPLKDVSMLNYGPNLNNRRDSLFTVSHVLFYKTLQ